MPFIGNSVLQECESSLQILVTGAAGFIGSNFVDLALKQTTHRLIGLDSLTYAGSKNNLTSALQSSRFEFIQADICDAEVIDDIVSRVDIVVNFAAETHNDRSIKSPNIFFKTNVFGTLNIAQACVKHSKRLHHISTDEVFGDLPLGTDDLFNEDTPYRPSSPYSASKASSDHIVRSWVRSFGLEATISNCSNNYGIRQHQEKLIPRSILLASKGIRPKLYGSGLNVRDWIHVDDHNSGILRILELGSRGETYLLGARSEISNRQVVETILSIMGHPKDFIDFVSDRPGHDRRYAIDPQKSNRVLSWQAQRTNFTLEIEKIIDYYLENQFEVDEINEHSGG